MGTTAQKLSYLNETKTKLKDKINLMGANITDDTFRSYPDKIKDGLLDIMNNGYEKVWNNWDKVTESGTEITLDNTEEAPMKLDLKGNTSQFSTTGKNLLNVTDYESHTFSANINGYAFSTAPKIQLTANTKYYISYNITASQTSTRNTPMMISPNYNYSYEKIQENYNQTAGRKVWEFTPTETGEFQFNYWCNTPNTNVTVSNFMITTANDTLYEIYTGGKASPNPDYPQEVKVVKGDNKIKIEGKNLYNNPSYTIGTYAYFKLPKENENYVLSIKLKENKSIPGGLYFGFTEYGDFQSTQNVRWLVVNGEYNTYISTTSENFKYFRNIVNDNILDYIAIYPTSYANTILNYFDIQLEKGTTATNYEPYISEEHTISLGTITNLLNLATITTGYVGSAGEIVSTANNNEAYSEFIKVKPSTQYTFKLYETNWSGYNTNNWLAVGEYTSQDNSNFITRQTMTTTTQNYFTITTSANTKYVRVSARGLANASKAQFNEGGVEDYVEYGNNPIELCKINTYQDKIIRTDGRNLLNPNGTTQTISGITFTNNGDGTFTANGTATANRSFQLTTDTFTLENGTYYTQSVITISGTQAGSIVPSFKDSNGTITYNYLSNNYTRKTTDTMTLNRYDYYLANGTTVNNWTFRVQLEKGSQATEYQPYGTGEYYKKQMVRHLSLAIANMNRTEDYPGWGEIPYLHDDYPSRNDPTFPSNVIGNIGGGRTYYGLNTNSTNSILFLNKGSWNMTQTQWQTNYPNLVLEFCYELATPNYIKITNNTLIKQLDAIKKSKASQTNISQENDGLPFEIDATALEAIE